MLFYHNKLNFKLIATLKKNNLNLHDESLKILYQLLYVYTKKLFEFTKKTVTLLFIITLNINCMQYCKSQSKITKSFVYALVIYNYVKLQIASSSLYHNAHAKIIMVSVTYGETCDF